MQHETLRRHSARHVVTVLDAYEGNKKLACRDLDITHPTLMRYLAEAYALGLVPSSASLPRMKAIA